MPITAYKGFNSDWTCRDHQFEVGKTYKLEGEPEICVHGFHACLNPMDVFGYYAPGQSKFAVVEVPDHVEEHEGDTKICGVEITIKAEMSLPEFIGKGVEYLLSKVKWDEAKESNTGNYSAATNTGYRSAATNTGNYSAATNTGYRSAATNTGYQSAATNTGNYSAATNTGNYSAATNTGNYSAATNTGDRSAATNTGDRSAATNTGNYSAATNTGYRSAATNTGNYSAATNTGYQSAATVEGQRSVAMASGYEGRASASEGSAIFLVDRDDEGEILHVFAGIAGRDDIKPGTFYTLKDGKPVEV